MGNYACFTFSTLYLVTLIDFYAAKLVIPVDQLSVKQVNEQYYGLIPATVDVNLPAKSWLIQQNLFDYASPHLHIDSELRSVNINLWSVVKDYLNPRTLEVNDLTVERERHFLKELTGCSFTNDNCVCDYI